MHELVISRVDREFGHFLLGAHTACMYSFVGIETHHMCTDLYL